MITEQLKQTIARAVKDDLCNWQTGIKQARALGLNTATHSQIVNGKTQNVLADARWIQIARYYGVEVNSKPKLKTVRTPVFNAIYEKLSFAQENSICGMLCDRADIGKTHTAKIYARENKNVAYIDCGGCKTIQEFIRALAKAFGLSNTGKLTIVREDLIFYLQTSEKPLVILDEYGDLRLPTVLEFKSLWNATDKYVGWFAMGANGLRAKIERNIDNDVLGFAEIFSRMGNHFQTITPDSEPDFKKFQSQQIAQIGKGNGCNEVQKLIADSKYSLRRIQTGIAKIDKNQNN